MKSNRIWILGTAVVVVAVLALGYLLGISPKLTELAAAEAQLQAVRAQNAQHQADLTALREEFEHIDELRDQLDELETAIPSHLGLPDFIRQLNTLAAATGVTIDSIDTGQPQTYNPPAVPGTMLDEDGNVVELPPAPANLLTVNILIKVKGSALGVQLFNDGLQKGERLFLVTGFVVKALGEVAPSDDEDAPPPPTFEGEVEGLAYVLEQPDAAPAS